MAGTVVAGTVVAGTVVAGTTNTTADNVTGTQDTIAGTTIRAGAQWLEPIIHYSMPYPYPFTEGTDMGRDMATVQATVMVQVMGTGTEEDTDLDWRRFPVNLFLFTVLSFHPYTIDA